MYQVQVWHGSTDARSFMTIHSFSALQEAMRYFSDGRRRRAMIVNTASRVVIVRKGEWF